MELDRRKLLAGLGASVGGLGLATVLGESRSRKVHVDFSGTIPSEKPLVKGETLALDGGPAYPNHYEALVSSRDELRWDYFAEDSALRLSAGDLEKTDWNSQLLVIFGLVLPRTKDLQPRDRTTLNDGTLTVPLTLDERSSGSSEPVIMNYLERVDIGREPEELAVPVTY
jgi:hypothetical protein